MIGNYKARDAQSRLLRGITYFAAVITAIVVIFIIAYILYMGLPQVKLNMFSWKYTTTNLSFMPAILNTVYITVISLLISLPISIGAAIYFNEYAAHGSKIVYYSRMATETLTGIPSIVYGLFGMLLFVEGFGWGYSILAGSLTISIMILPVMTRTTEESLIAVDMSLREGSYALGAGRARTIFRVVLPSAMSGVYAGIILAIGRIVGESAALIYTAGTSAAASGNPMDSGRTLAVHMYAMFSEGLYIKEAYATAVILLIIVAGLNAASAAVARRIGRSIR